MSNSAAEPQTLFSSFVSFFVPTAHAEAPAPEEPKEEAEESPEKAEEAEDAGEEEEAEEEDEEPVDPAEEIRAECEKTACVPQSNHFKHCAEKVEGGKGWKGEDCVEELYHLMHCVDACAAPKLFKKLA